jgi:hypothetical protein
MRVCVYTRTARKSEEIDILVESVNPQNKKRRDVPQTAFLLPIKFN